MKPSVGGRQEFSGADTCVYVPPVRCEGEAEREPGVVSRILPTAQAARDIAIEAYIRRQFPALVANGSVTVHTKRCVPAFADQDNELPSSLTNNSGCQRVPYTIRGPIYVMNVDGTYPLDAKGNKIPHFENLLTPVRSGSFYPRFNRETLAVSLFLLTDALSAAISLCPDSGPWVIHADLHFGNILYYTSTDQRIHTSLNDWGRTVVVNDPNNIESLKTGILEWMPATVYNTDPLVVLQTLVRDGFAQRPQHPPILFDRLYRGFQNRNENEIRRILRGWVPYVILTQAGISNDIAEYVLACDSQAAVVAVLAQIWNIAVPWPSGTIPPAPTAVDRGTPPGGPVRTPEDIAEEAIDVERGRAAAAIAVLQAREEAEEEEARRKEIEKKRRKERREWQKWLAEEKAEKEEAEAEAEAEKKRIAALPFWKRALGINKEPKIVPMGGAYFPPKYFRGLSTRKTKQRRREITRRARMSFKNPKAYVPFKTDKGVKTRKSSYTERFHRKYPGATSIPEIAKVTGIRKSILDTVYDRGMAAWRTGHRPGASQQAWGMARVYSFALKGKTYRTADADLARKV
jgi:hypothetical protein